MAALTVHAAGSPLQPADGSPFNLPMASLEGRPGVAWTSLTMNLIMCIQSAPTLCIN